MSGKAPLRLPSGYRLDTSDPDILYLRRADGTVAGVFSAQGATAWAVEDAAREDLQGRVPPHPPREHAARYPRRRRHRARTRSADR